MTEHSDIATFYSGKNVLITGATGFLGKVLLEKILRTCEDVGTIYLTVRAKKGRTKEERLKKLFESQAFSNIIDRKSQIDKVVAIGADFSEDSLGLSTDDTELLLSNVDVIIHCAATVRFMEKLKKAVQINVKGLDYLVTLAKRMKKLQVFIHVSTAYSFSNRFEIGETTYEPRLKANEIIQLCEILDEASLEALTPTLLDGWPNTYTLTKAIGEDLLVGGHGFPVAIVRPSIVAPSAQEPFPGWTDSLLGPVGVMIGFVVGFLRVIALDEKAVVDIIPADYAACTILASGWDVCHRGESKPLVYNCVSSPDYRLTWGYFTEYFYKIYLEMPCSRAIWYPVIIFTTSQRMLKIYRFLVHRIPAKIVDFFAWIIGNPFRLSQMYDKVERLCDTLEPFTLKSYKFHNGHVTSMWERMSDVDRKLFMFKVDNVDWLEAINSKMVALHFRTFMLKDKPETIPQARIRLKILKVIHYFFLTIIGLVFFYVIYLVISPFF